MSAIKPNKNIPGHEGTTISAKYFLKNQKASHVCWQRNSLATHQYLSSDINRFCEGGMAGLTTIEGRYHVDNLLFFYFDQCHSVLRAPLNLTVSSSKTVT